MSFDVSKIHATLKAQTNDVHQALHVHPKISCLMTNDIAEDAYYRLLKAYRGYYRYVEHCRCEMRIWPELSLENALIYIDQDLSKQNDALHCASDALIERCQSDPLVCLGMLYVLHGASLGGRVIAKSMHKTLPNVSTDFFRFGVGMEQWKNLLSTLEKYIQNEDQLEIVVASARSTFIHFGVWVEEKA